MGVFEANTQDKSVPREKLEVFYPGSRTNPDEAGRSRTRSEVATAIATKFHSIGENRQDAVHRSRNFGGVIDPRGRPSPRDEHFVLIPVQKNIISSHPVSTTLAARATLVKKCGREVEFGKKRGQDRKKNRYRAGATTKWWRRHAVETRATTCRAIFSRWPAGHPPHTRNAVHRAKERQEGGGFLGATAKGRLSRRGKKYPAPRQPINLMEAKRSSRYFNMKRKSAHLHMPCGRRRRCIVWLQIES